MNSNNNGVFNEITGYFYNDSSNIYELENWMNFFIHLGKYSAKHKNINVLLSYIDDILPVYFITAGIIDDRLTYYKTYKEELLKIIKEKILTEEFLIVLTDEGIWREARIIEIKELENMKTEFNPYIIVDVIYPKQELVREYIPNTKWLDRIRLTNRYKSTAGTKVTIEDTTSEFLSNFFDQSLLNLLKASSQILVNIIGFNYKTTLNKYLEELNFKTKNYNNIKMNEIILHNDSEYSYVNTNMINNLKDSSENDGINIYIGPLTTMNSNFSHSKSIYVLNRKKNNKEKRDLAISKFKKNTRKSQNITEDFINYLEENNILVPKGVECFVTRKN